MSDQWSVQFLLCITDRLQLVLDAIFYCASTIDPLVASCNITIEAVCFVCMMRNSDHVLPSGFPACNSLNNKVSYPLFPFHGHWFSCHAFNYWFCLLAVYKTGTIRWLIKLFVVAHSIETIVS